MSDNKVKIHIFHCVNSYSQPDLLRGIDRQLIDPVLIPMPCSGKLDVLYLTKAFETGTDGVAVMVCQQNDCRYLEGSKRATRRASAVADLLEEAGLEKGRITVIPMTGSGTAQAVAELQEFCGKIAGKLSPVPVS
jgi:F420-non-reducing hydrogenase iron-sulfur subunit